MRSMRRIRNVAFLGLLVTLVWAGSANLSADSGGFFCGYGDCVLTYDDCYGRGSQVAAVNRVVARGCTSQPCRAAAKCATSTTRAQVCSSGSTSPVETIIVLPVFRFELTGLRIP